MGFIKEEDLIKILSEVFDIPVLELGREEIDPSATKLISYDVAKRYGVFPVRREGDTLLLAMSNPQDIIALDDIKIMTNMKIKPILSTKSDIANSIEKHYQLDDTLYDLLKDLQCSSYCVYKNPGRDGYCRNQKTPGRQGQNIS